MAASAAEILPLLMNALHWKDLSAPLEWPVPCVLPQRKGQRWRVTAMQKLMEFYEMVSINDAALSGTERTTILKARLALNMFERAMESCKRASAEAPAPVEPRLAMAA